MLKELTLVGSYLDPSVLDNSVKNNTDYVQLITQLTTIASVFFAFVVIIAGFHYMSARANQAKLDRAKAILRNAVIGFIFVLGASVGANVINQSQGSSLPPVSYEVSPANDAGSEDVDPVQRAVSIFLIDSVKFIREQINNSLSSDIINIKPISTNSPALAIWVAVVILCDVLLVLVLILQGFKIMGSEVFGQQVDIRSMIPETIVVFGLIHSSIYLIDAVGAIINLSMTELTKFITGGVNSLEEVMTYLSAPDPDKATIGMAFMYIVFTIVTVLLLFYYMIRNLLLILGAVLSPLVLLSQLIPGLKGMLGEGIKQYLSLMFVTIGHTVLFLVLWAYLQSSAGDSNQFMRIIIVTAGMLLALKVAGGISGLMSAAGAHGAYKGMRQAITNNTMTRAVGNMGKRGGKASARAVGGVAKTRGSQFVQFAGGKAKGAYASTKSKVKGIQRHRQEQKSIKQKASFSRDYSVGNRAPTSHQLSRGDMSLPSGAVMLDMHKRPPSVLEKMKKQNAMAERKRAEIVDTKRKNYANEKTKPVVKPAAANVPSGSVPKKSNRPKGVTVNRVKNRVPAQKRGGKS